MQQNKIQKDILIIGAGPVGLFAVFQCGMLGLSCCVIDALAEIGGQCSALYPEKPIYDIPAHPTISAENLIRQLEKQAQPFNPTYCLNQEAQSYKKNNNKFTITTSKGSEIITNSIIIAAGGGAFGPNRPPLDNIQTYEGKSIFYMVKRRQDFANKIIAIAGGGDSAVDWCLSLSEVAKKIYFIHRRDKFRAAPESVRQIHELAKSGKVELIIPFQPTKLIGDNQNLNALEVTNLDGQTKSLKIDVFLPFFGLSSSLESLSNWGLTIDNNRIEVNPLTQQTKINGIYAIGDGCLYQGKLKLILQGFSEAATAAHSAHAFIHPDKILHFEHSTTKGLPKP